MPDNMEGTDPNLTSSTNPSPRHEPVDPSNTSLIGQKVEQGIIDIKKGISEQSSEQEDNDERNNRKNIEINRSENYLKNPSPEENDIEIEP